MMKMLGFATVLLALGFAGTGHAHPITVWTYGDGQTSRMYSELQYLSKPGITVVKKAVEGTGPDNSSTGTTLAQRIFADLALGGTRPNLIHIGYNASAFSFLNCSSSTDPAVWGPNVVSIAGIEATAIKDAADFATRASIQVLLSKGPGVPYASAEHDCMTQAFATVTYFLALIAPQYLWTDYSGYTQDPRVSAQFLDPALLFIPGESVHWEADATRVHVSCDKTRYFYPGNTGYLWCVNVADETARKKLGAYRIAKTVLQAYQHFQL